jgi:hypothetical protein
MWPFLTPHCQVAPKRKLFWRAYLTIASGRGPEVRFEDIAIDFSEPRFWPVTQVTNTLFSNCHLYYAPIGKYEKSYLTIRVVTRRTTRKVQGDL